MNIPLITLPIAWTILCFLVTAFWPSKPTGNNYFNLDLEGMAVAVFCVMASMVGWIVYLALK